MPPSQALKVKHYQQEGIDFLTARNRAYIFDDAGLGKSMQMILAANNRNAHRLLVLAPAIGRVSWALQFETWDDTKRPVYQWPSDTAGMIPASGPCAIIVSVDLLSNPQNYVAIRAALNAGDPMDMVIIDEAHYLANPTALRTQAIYGTDYTDSVLKGAKGCWVATATPTPKHAGQLYSHLRAVTPGLLRDLFPALGRLPTQEEFEDEFCEVRLDTKRRRGALPVRIVEGNRATEIVRLAEALANYMLVRHKAEVLQELDPIIACLLPLDVKGNHPAADALLTKSARENMSGDQFLSELSALYQAPTSTGIISSDYASYRRDLGERKAHAAMPWIIDYLTSDPDRKLVIFAHHGAVIDYIQSRLAVLQITHGVIRGKTNTEHRAQAVKLFQEGKLRVIIGQNKAAGTAITLTAADTCLLLEPHPTPDVNYQAISRLHRIGQQGSVNAHFAFAAEEPTERRMARILQRRAQDNLQLFGGTTAQGVIPRLLQPTSPLPYFPTT